MDELGYRSNKNDDFSPYEDQNNRNLQNPSVNNTSLNNHLTTSNYNVKNKSNLNSKVNLSTNNINLNKDQLSSHKSLNEVQRPQRIKAHTSNLNLNSYKQPIYFNDDTINHNYNQDSIGYQSTLGPSNSNANSSIKKLGSSNNTILTNDLNDKYLGGKIFYSLQ